MDRYILKVFFLLSLIVACAVTVRMGPEFPVFNAFKYGGTALLVALGAYLTGFLGMMAYMVAQTKMVDEALGAAGMLEKFTQSLSEPISWANWSLGTTVLYHAMTGSGVPFVWASAFVISAAVIATTAFSILRNFHLLTLYLTTTMRAMLVQQTVKDMMIKQIEDSIERAVQNGDLDDDPEAMKCNCDECRAYREQGAKDKTTVQ